MEKKPKNGEHVEHEGTKQPCFKFLREEILEIKKTISFRATCHIFPAEKLEERRRF